MALADRRASTLTDRISLLRKAFRVAKTERPFTIDAVVILPDHLHIILTLPEDDADFVRRWRRVKTLFTQGLLAEGIAYSRRDGTGRDVWQRRFWEHRIRDDNDFTRHVDYIHLNPTRHGLVSNPSDWPFSSLHRFMRIGIIPSGWGANVPMGDGFGEPDEPS